MSLIIPTYHYVRDFRNTRYPDIKGLDINEFEFQINHLNANYTILSPADVKRKIIEKIPFEDHDCWLTFDDGYKDHFEYVRPLLNKLGLKASFFPPVATALNRTILDVNLIHHILAVNSDRELILQEIKDMYFETEVTHSDYNFEKIISTIDIPNEMISHPYDDKETLIIKRLLQRDLPEMIRATISEKLFQKYISNDIESFAGDLYMNIDEIEQLYHEGHEIGSHGYNHCWLSRLDYKKQLDEIQKTKEFWLQRGIFQENWTICYPYGDFNEDTINISKDCGALIGLTVEHGIASMKNNDMLRLPRVDTNELPKQ